MTGSCGKGGSDQELQAGAPERAQELGQGRLGELKEQPGGNTAGAEGGGSW